MTLLTNVKSLHCSTHTSHITLGTLRRVISNIVAAYAPAKTCVNWRFSQFDELVEMEKKYEVNKKGKVC